MERDLPTVNISTIRFWTANVLALFVVLCSSPAIGQDHFQDAIAILGSRGRHLPETRRVAEALRKSALALHVDDRAMPAIVVLEASKNEARVADVNDWAHVFIEKHDSGKTVYMVWMIGDLTEADLVQLFMNVLNDEFRLGMSTADVNAAARRLFVAGSSVTSVESLLGRSH